MSYVEPNFKTKKALREALAARAAWEQLRATGPMTIGAVLAAKTPEPPRIRVFQPGLGEVPVDGVVYLEGPHFPEPHRWYARGVMRGGVLVSVK